MWVLYGVCAFSGHPDEISSYAKFSSEELAREYIKKSSLKKPTRYTAFKAKSLLGGCCEAYVEYEDELDIDPVF
ncbi:MAG: hypothetical protein ACTSW7_01000 [Candidatus Thorarchaeota archaeon]|nr:MAG: hypothetical protein DRQ25_04815 [Candidatus Fermentibacteria bacterium]HEC72046.1 hypothetical protein [Thermoplasmatales archaeon]